MEEQACILEFKNISKTFPGVKVLNNVSFTVKKGTVHVLIGENGAGKSTLMKILMGIYPDYNGEIYVHGHIKAHIGVKQTLDLGISMIHQELTYVPDMTIAENIFLGKEPTLKGGSWIDSKKVNQETIKLLRGIGMNLDPKRLLKDLSIAERQMVEIAKALSYDAKIIIMDEPTSALSDREVERLFLIINDLKEKGVAIIYISHKLDEIFKIADEITVLRDGCLIRTCRADEIDTDKLVTMMVGRKLKEIFPKPINSPGPEFIAVKGLCKKGVFQNISFAVRKGEILGLAGLMGAGSNNYQR
jgi:inositol transport system ATP-binding protein